MQAQSPGVDPYYVNMAIWHLYELLRARDNELKKEEVSDNILLASTEHTDLSPQLHSPMNMIYFGPPGTG